MLCIEKEMCLKSYRVYLIQRPYLNSLDVERIWIKNLSYSMIKNELM